MFPENENEKKSFCIYYQHVDVSIRPIKNKNKNLQKKND